MRTNLGLVALAVTLVACGGQDAPRYLTAEQTRADYVEASTTLTLPPGMTFTAPTHAATADDGNRILYESGSGRIDAQYFWYCAWATEAVRATDPTTALETMQTIENMELWDALDIQGRVQFTRQVDSAFAGDLADVAHFVDMNCASAAST